LLYDAPFSHNT